MYFKKVALIYDRVNTPHGGAEKVLLALKKLFPNAPLYTSVYDTTKAKWAKKFTVIPSFLNKFSFVRNNHRLAAFLMPLAFESFNFGSYDLIISVTSAEAKGIISKPHTKHICYLLTPTRYLYSHDKFYKKTKLIFKIPILNHIARLLLNYLRHWDQVAIYRPDIIIPISNLVKTRANNFYDVKINNPIYPSIVNSKRPPYKTKTLTILTKNYFLIVSRLVSYKKINLAIKACQKLNKKLIIVGSGPELGKLKTLINKHSSKNIKLLGNVKKIKLEKLYQNCIAVIMPGEEDFGITALEALSYGKPVIINQRSGAGELIIEKKTGLLIKDTQTDLERAILELDTIDFDPAIMKCCVDKHNTSYFKKEFARQIYKAKKTL